MTETNHLRALENEAIEIFRDGIAEARRPVLLFSGGKDSTVLAHLAHKAFHPAPPPLPLLHIDSTWEFAELLAFRDSFSTRYGFELIVYANEAGRERGLNPIDHPDAYTLEMRTQALKTALDVGGYDLIFGGARRDEEASRSKERVVSVRGAGHTWEPRNQRPELWRTFNWRLSGNQTIRAFPLSNWTEIDLWQYIAKENITLAPLYYACKRTVVHHDGIWIALDEPARWTWGGTTETRVVRFRTLGCWPVTGAIASQATDAADIIREIISGGTSERVGRVGIGRSLETHKREGYF